MRLKVLLLFVALQIGSFLIWRQLHADQWVFVAPATASTAHAAATALNQVRFASRHTEANFSPIQEEALKTQIFDTLAQLPKNHAESVKNIILDYDPQAHRGMGGKQIVILRATMDPQELTGVLVHEIGHNVDLVALKNPVRGTLSGFKDGQNQIYLGDLSLDFYRISWNDEKTLKRAAGNLDFVSGYAMTDPFEDFGETYAYYVLHHQDFKALTATSAALYAKYKFMRDQVFGGVEFATGDGVVKELTRPWDVTVLSYEMSTFLN